MEGGACRRGVHAPRSFLNEWLAATSLSTLKSTPRHTDRQTKRN